MSHCITFVQTYVETLIRQGVYYVSMEELNVNIEVGDTIKSGDYEAEVIGLTDEVVITADGARTYRRSVELNIAHDDRKRNVELIKGN